MMSDRELLSLCADAFAAVPDSAQARKVLKRLAKVPAACVDTDSNILAREMIMLIREHFGW
jgi:hypothetical protein